MTVAQERLQLLWNARFWSSPLVWIAIVGAIIASVLVIVSGVAPFLQVTANGLVAGSYFALGAAGISLIYGILRLINFAHGDYLTLGAYLVVLFNAVLGTPLWIATLAATMGVAVLGVLLEKTIWRPMRRRGAGTLHTLLAAIGIAFTVRYTIQVFAGTNQRLVGFDVASFTDIGGLRIGTTHLMVLVIGSAAMLGLGLMLRFTTLGKQLRAMSDNPMLAEATGIRTDRLIVFTQALAGGLAGLAGVLFGAAIGVVNPNLGFFILLSLISATILGGISNPFGVLAGGVILGLAQEWSTLVIDPTWKIAVGFAILVGVLLVRPRGIFGHATPADRG